MQHYQILSHRVIKTPQVLLTNIPDYKNMKLKFSRNKRKNFAKNLFLTKSLPKHSVCLLLLFSSLQNLQHELTEALNLNSIYVYHEKCMR